MTSVPNNQGGKMHGAVDVFLRLPTLVQALIVVFSLGGATGGIPALASRFTTNPQLSEWQEQSTSRISALEEQNALLRSEVEALRVHGNLRLREIEIQSEYLACLNDRAPSQDVIMFCGRIRDQVHKTLDLLNGR